MKSPVLFSSVILLSSILVLFSCKKEGTGGHATIAASPKHHEKSIKGAIVYVKFGAKELPGKTPSDYDLTIKGEPNEDHIHIEGLMWGDYYLYAVGYDSTLAQTVSGGIPVTIKRSEKKSELSIVIPVTE